MKAWMAGILAAYAMLTASAAGAATESGQFAAKGAGRARCAFFIDAKTRNLPEHLEMISYFEGFLTAANRYEPDTYDLAPWHTAGMISAIVEHYCKSNADQTLAFVAASMAATLKPLRLSAESKLIAVGEAPNRVMVYEEVLRRAQAALKTKGIFQGQPDGKVNPETQAAIQAFQSEKKLEPTGIPDAATLWYLLNP
jgi:hypothetical protein